jgi:hypothetical protein
LAASQEGVSSMSERVSIIIIIILSSSSAATEQRRLQCPLRLTSEYSAGCSMKENNFHSFAVKMYTISQSVLPVYNISKETSGRE